MNPLTFAAAAVPDSTIWASSSTTRHHLNRVRGVGSIAYLRIPRDQEEGVKEMYNHR